MSCLSTHRIAESRTDQYATSEDFRQLFTEDSRGLYLLSFLLTANHEMAERCFVASLDECLNRNSVFREWAHSWARRMIVRNALRMITLQPSLTRPVTVISESEGDGNLAGIALQDFPVARVLALESFERFVYVLAVLEKYPDQNCAVLLGVSKQTVREAKTSALRHVANFDRGETAPTNDLPCVGVGQETAMTSAA